MLKGEEKKKEDEKKKKKKVKIKTKKNGLRNIKKNHPFNIKMKREMFVRKIVRLC